MIYNFDFYAYFSAYNHVFKYYKPQTMFIKLLRPLKIFKDL